MLNSNPLILLPGLPTPFNHDPVNCIPTQCISKTYRQGRPALRHAMPLINTSINLLLTSSDHQCRIHFLPQSSSPTPHTHTHTHTGYTSHLIKSLYTMVLHYDCNKHRYNNQHMPVQVHYGNMRMKPLGCLIWGMHANGCAAIS